jgi:hypothetical protein
MEARNLLTRVTRTTCACWAYGVIANTDRHYGNISLLLEDWMGVATYDICPVLYAPVASEIVPYVLTPPTAATLAVIARWRWRQAFGRTGPMPASPATFRRLQR